MERCTRIWHAWCGRNGRRSRTGGARTEACKHPLGTLLYSNAAGFL